jgi:squalene synthase HpnC
MTNSAALRSGKGHRDENFPVASFLIRRRHRPAILAFYNFVRVADDIADHPSLSRHEKLTRLDRLEASLLGDGSDEPEGVRLHQVLRDRELPADHAQHLLKAFRQDVVKDRYDNWSDLIGYCTYSAMPVGRFVLQVHGESKSTWPASDALCAALQIINHLQDCAADYRKLNRVYLPLDALSRHGADAESLAAPQASPELMRCLRDLAAQTEILLQKSRALPDTVEDTRLAMEISAIQTLARRLIVILRERDPLSQRVHLTKMQAMTRGVASATLQLFRVLGRRASAFYRSQAHEY